MVGKASSPEMPRADSECTNGSHDDEELVISNLWEVDLPAESIGGGDQEKVENEKNYITLRERRQIKLGLRKVDNNSILWFGIFYCKIIYTLGYVAYLINCFVVLHFYLDNPVL